MSNYLNTFLFGIYPYIALAVLALGSIIRYDREPYSWRAGSSQLLRRKQLVWGSVLFHVGVIVIFLGHLLGLLTRFRYSTPSASVIKPNKFWLSWLEESPV